jgi:endonuclease/exonuclease/phosphatase (EEP) superfamily protein YafD
MEALRWVVVGLGLWLASGTLLSLSHHPHWYVRGWDFPRVLIAALAFICGAVYRALFWGERRLEIAFLFALGAVIVYQVSRIVAFTPLARKRVRPAKGSRGDSSFRLVISNVLMENDKHDLWRSVIAAEDPDIVVALEVDGKWMSGLAPLRGDYPHVVDRAQDNYYGMVVFSRLPLENTEVRHLVDDETPSIRTTVRLRDGTPVVFYALHPKPPEPIRDQDSAPRDAELVLVAKEIAAAPPQPTLVCGDLNDVAWSDTTRIFLRLSGMLDPRIGRGLLNTYNANNPLFRFPLDHVFHSNHFRLFDLRRLPHVGSDHFPVCIELNHEPDAPAEQKPSEAGESDVRVAEEIVDRQVNGGEGEARR